MAKTFEQRKQYIQDEIRSKTDDQSLTNDQEAQILDDLNVAIKENGDNISNAQKTANDANIAISGLQDDIKDINHFKTDRKEIFNISQVTNNYAYADKQSARNAVIGNARARGQIVAYQTAHEGWVIEQYVGESVTNWGSATNWRPITNDIRDIICEMDGNGIDKYGREINDREYRGRTAFLQLSESGIVLSNISVLAGNKISDNIFAAVWLYDDKCNYVGYLTTTISGNVINTFAIDKTYIDANFPTAYYFRTNIYNPVAFNVYYPSGIIRSKKQAFVDRECITEGWFDLIGYTHKLTGQLTDADISSYRTTPFMVLDSTPNITVTGFSGITNYAALCLCFDANLKYLGYINAPSHGNVTEYTFLKKTLPTDTYYVRFNRFLNQKPLILGAKLITNNSELQKFVINTSNISAQPQIQPANDSLILSQGKLSVNVADGFGSSETKTVAEYTIKKLLYNILPFKNYLGNAENIHPKVLYFANGLWGFKFWMAYTPYPLGNTTAENPCIAVSNDGVNWTVPNGLVNPLAFPPENSNGGYNSDTHLVYREDIKTLECWYRPVKLNPTRDAIVRKVTTDGVNWGKEEVVIDYGTSYNNVLSPAVVFEDGKYKMWTCTGNYVMYRQTSGDSINEWSTPVRMQIDWGNLNAWHLDVINNGVDGYDMVVCAFGVGGGNNSADLYHVKQLYNGEFTKPIAIVKRSKNPLSITYRSIYRSSIVLVNNEYNIYVSCIDNNWHRYMYLYDNSIFLNKLP